MSIDFKPSKFSQVFVLAVYFSCILYTLFNRPVLEVIMNSFLIGFTISAFLTLLLMGVSKKYTKVNLRLKVTFEFLCSISLSGLFFYSLYTVLDDFISFYKGTGYRGHLLTPLIIIILLLIGFCLFFIRLKYRTVYGLSEVFFGVYIGLKLIPKDLFNVALNSNIYIAVVTASIYLIVRGLDNIHIGLVKGPVDPIGQRIQSFFVEK